MRAIVAVIIAALITCPVARADGNAPHYKLVCTVTNVNGEIYLNDCNWED